MQREDLAYPQGDNNLKAYVWYLPNTEEGQELNHIVGVVVVELHFIQRVDGLCQPNGQHTTLQVNRELQGSTTTTGK